MRVAVTNAKGQLTELVRRAEAGEEILLTRHGKAVARLVPVEAAASGPNTQKTARGGTSFRCRQGAGRGKRGEKSGLPLWTGWLARMIAVDTSALMASGRGKGSG